MGRVVVTCAFGHRKDVGKLGEEDFIGKYFPDKIERFKQGFQTHSPHSVVYAWVNNFPPGSPSHDDSPYAFKVYAIKEAVRRGATTVLWADSSVHPVQNLEPLWRRIETDGYWLPDNRSDPEHDRTCGEWTCDSALEPLGITRQEAFNIPQITATTFGLDFRHKIAVDFLQEWERLEKAGAFKGPWINTNHEASDDDCVLGHRHDQTAASVIAHRLGMKLTKQPMFLGDPQYGSRRVFLHVER